MKLPKTILLNLVIQILLSLNPGVVLRIHKKNLTGIIKVGVSVINPFLKNVFMDEWIDTGMLKIETTNMNMEDIKSEQVTCIETQRKDFLQCQIIKAQFNMASTAYLDAVIFKNHGKIMVRGILDVVTLKIGFMDFNTTHFGRPYVAINLDEITFDKNTLKINLDFRGIPSFLVEKTIEFFKSKVISKLRDEIMKFANKQGSDKINMVVHKVFPHTVILDPVGISLQTALLFKPSIDEHDLVIGIDGTFFDTQSGYKRDKDAAEVTGDAMDHFFGDVSLTNYTINSFFQAIYQKRISMSLGPIQLEMISTTLDPDVSISPSLIQISRMSGITRGESGSNFGEVTMDVSLDMIVGIHTSIDFFLDLDIPHFDLHEFKMKTNIPMISYFESAIRFFLEQAIKYFHSFSLDIPNFVLPFDMKVVDVGLQMNHGYVQLGLTVEIDHVIPEIIKAFQTNFEGQSNFMVSAI